MPKRKKITIISLLLILFLSASPLTLSIDLTHLDSNEKKNIDEEDLNAKIEEIIIKINRSIIEDFFYELMSIGPRMTETYGCQKAGNYIYNCFNEFNLEVERHSWSSFGNRWNPRFYQSENIIGTLQGSNVDDSETIILNAHYDTVKDSIGANDDGSGVVGVLATAYVLSQYNFDKTIRFVCFSGEEIGLLGSTAYAKKVYENNEDILIEFNADMIGRATTKQEGKNIRLSHTEDTQWIIDIMRKINKSTDYFHLEISDLYPYNRDARRGGSDYFGFITHGYESISLWEKASDPYANTPDDIISNVNISYLVNTTRMLAATIGYIADIEDQPPRITIATPRRGKVYHNDEIIKSLDDHHIRIFNDIWIYTDIKTYDSDIELVEFYYDNTLVSTKEEIPYVWHLNERSFGKHKITVKVYDDIGRHSTDQINIFYINLIKFR